MRQEIAKVVADRATFEELAEALRAAIEELGATLDPIAEKLNASRNQTEKTRLRMARDGISERIERLQSLLVIASNHQPDDYLIANGDAPSQKNPGLTKDGESLAIVARQFAYAGRKRISDYLARRLQGTSPSLVELIIFGGTDPDQHPAPLYDESLYLSNVIEVASVLLGDQPPTTLSDELVPKDCDVGGVEYFSMLTSYLEDFLDHISEQFRLMREEDAREDVQFLDQSYLWGLFRYYQVELIPKAYHWPNAINASSIPNFHAFLRFYLHDDEDELFCRPLVAEDESYMDEYDIDEFDAFERTSRDALRLEEEFSNIGENLSALSRWFERVKFAKHIAVRAAWLLRGNSVPGLKLDTAPFLSHLERIGSFASADDLDHLGKRLGEALKSSSLSVISDEFEEEFTNFEQLLDIIRPDFAEWPREMADLYQLVGRYSEDEWHRIMDLDPPTRYH